jgi:hypothetical protein
MNKNQYKTLRERKITNTYCIENPMSEVVKILRNNNNSKLWDKMKKDWNIQDWTEFFKLKIDYYDQK